MDRLYTAEDLARVAHDAVTAALAKIAQTPPPPSALPAWCSTQEYAAFSGKARKTIAEYARRAPPELAQKRGRDWRVAGPRFDAWVLAGGPFRVHDEDPKVH